MEKKLQKSHIKDSFNLCHSSKALKDSIQKQILTTAKHLNTPIILFKNSIKHCDNTKAFVKKKYKKLIYTPSSNKSVLWKKNDYEIISHNDKRVHSRLNEEYTTVKKYYRNCNVFNTENTTIKGSILNRSTGIM